MENNFGNENTEFDVVPSSTSRFTTTKIVSLVVLFVTAAVMLVSGRSKIQDKSNTVKYSFWTVFVVVVGLFFYLLFY